MTTLLLRLATVVLVSSMLPAKAWMVYAQPMGDAANDRVELLFESLASRNARLRRQDDARRREWAEVERLEQEQDRLRDQGRSSAGVDQELARTRRTIIAELEESDPVYANEIGRYRDVLAFIFQAGSAQAGLEALARRGQAGRAEIEFLVEQTAPAAEEADAEPTLLMLRAVALGLLAGSEPDPQRADNYWRETILLYLRLARTRPDDVDLKVMVVEAILGAGATRLSDGYAEDAFGAAAAARQYIDESGLEEASRADWYYAFAELNRLYAGASFQTGDAARGQEHLELAIRANMALLTLRPDSPTARRQAHNLDVLAAMSDRGAVGGPPKSAHR